MKNLLIIEFFTGFQLVNSFAMYFFHRTVVYIPYGMSVVDTNIVTRFLHRSYFVLCNLSVFIYAPTNFFRGLVVRHQSIRSEVTASICSFIPIQKNPDLKVYINGVNCISLKADAEAPVIEIRSCIMNSIDVPENV